MAAALEGRGGIAKPFEAHALLGRQHISRNNRLVVCLQSQFILAQVLEELPQLGVGDGQIVPPNAVVWRAVRQGFAFRGPC